MANKITNNKNKVTFRDTEIIISLVPDDVIYCLKVRINHRLIINDMLLNSKKADNLVIFTSLFCKGRQANASK